MKMRKILLFITMSLLVSCEYKGKYHLTYIYPDLYDDMENQFKKITNDDRPLLFEVEFDNKKAATYEISYWERDLFNKLSNNGKNTLLASATIIYELTDSNKFSLTFEYYTDKKIDFGNFSFIRDDNENNDLCHDLGMNCGVVNNENSYYTMIDCAFTNYGTEYIYIYDAIETQYNQFLIDNNIGK